MKFALFLAKVINREIHTICVFHIYVLIYWIQSFQANHVQENHAVTKENVLMLVEKSCAHVSLDIMAIDVNEEVLLM